MRQNLALGYTAAIAARMALRTPARPDRPDPENALHAAQIELMERLEGFQDVEAQGVLDKALAEFSTEAVLRDVVLPCLRELGERWEAGEVSVGPGALRERGPARAPARAGARLRRGRGPARPARLPLRRPPRPRASCASASGSASTAGASPSSAPTRRSRPSTGRRSSCSPTLVVVCAEQEAPLRAALDAIAMLAAEFPVALAGRGSSAEMAHATGSRLLQDAPMAAAARIAAGG